MTTSQKNLTQLLPNQIPEYVQTYYPLFVIFVTQYYKFLQNSSSGTQYALQNIALDSDIDTTASNLVNEFLNTYAPGFPNTSAVDQTVLVKYFRQFFAHKGDEQSFKFFFRAFFNDDIRIDYPRNYLFAPSSGDYYQEQRLTVSGVIGDPTKLIHTTVTGLTNGATGQINDVVKASGIGGENVYNLVFQHQSLTNINYDNNGNPIYFTPGESITGTFVDFVNNVSSNIVVSAISSVITDPGRYLDSKSQLSSDQLLQDSYYYQQFSYVLRTKETYEKWFNHVLNYLHPTGTKLFNDLGVDTVPGFTTGSKTTSVARTEKVETTVQIPSIKKYLVNPTFSFDRLADGFTGTSTTQRVSSNGQFYTVTYTSANSTYAYNTSYAYVGEKITWALQKAGDIGTPTQIERFDGASFDKYIANVSLAQQIIAWPYDVNSSIVQTEFIQGTGLLSSNTLLTSFKVGPLMYNTTSLSVNSGVGSVMLLLSWVKDTYGNAISETSNAVVISFSSNVSVIPNFSVENQRNYQWISLGDSLDIKRLAYYHNTSTSITSPNVSSNVSYTSTSVIGQQNGLIIFKPFNANKASTFDRCSIYFQIDQPQQLNTSLSQYFTNANITSNGLIATWGSSSFATSVGALSFNNNSSSIYTFSSTCFIYNGNTSDTRQILTNSFITSAIVQAQVSYIVGDNFNGGTAPTAGQDLDLEMSLDGGNTWTIVSNLWSGSSSNVWTYGTTSIAGGLVTAAGSNYLTGVGTLFGTGINVGDRITLTNSNTNVTSYTVQSIISNNLMTVSPNFVDYNLNLVPLNGLINTTIGNVLFTGTATTFLTQLAVGSVITLSSSNTTTTYTVTGVIDNTDITVNPSPTGTAAGLQGYLVTGNPGYYKKPAAQSFYNTSVTVYAGSSTSVLVKVIQIAQTGPNTINYALSSLTVSSWRFQNTTGNLNISVSVSSGSTLNTTGNDFFTATLIGGTAS